MPPLARVHTARSPTRDGGRSPASEEEADVWSRRRVFAGGAAGAPDAGARMAGAAPVRAAGGSGPGNGAAVAATTVPPRRADRPGLRGAGGEHAPAPPAGPGQRRRPARQERVRAGAEARGEDGAAVRGGADGPEDPGPLLRGQRGGGHV